MSTRNYYQEPRRNVREVTADVDPQIDVWLGAHRYHDDRNGICACPEQINNTDAGTLAEAAEQGKRPCKTCRPVDYLAEGGDANGV